MKVFGKHFSPISFDKISSKSYVKLCYHGTFSISTIVLQVHKSSFIKLTTGTNVMVFEFFAKKFAKNWRFSLKLKTFEICFIIRLKIFVILFSSNKQVKCMYAEQINKTLHTFKYISNVNTFSGNW
jgi:hypothetical protein